MNGYILISRSILESDIWKKPPLYLKVWNFLLIKAQYKPFKQLERGQLFTSIREIQDACTYYTGYRKTVPSKDQIYKILDWLRSAHESNNEGETKAPMITTMKATHGIIVTICNFNVYQCPENYEGCNESDNERTAKAERKKFTANNINEERIRKNKKDKKDIYSDLPSEIHQPLKDYIEMRKKSKKPMTDHAIELLIGKLDKLSGGDIQTQIEMLHEAEMKNWMSVYLPKDEKLKSNTRTVEVPKGW